MSHTLKSLPPHESPFFIPHNVLIFRQLAKEHISYLTCAFTPEIYDLFCTSSQQTGSAENQIFFITLEKPCILPKNDKTDKMVAYLRGWSKLIKGLENPWRVAEEGRRGNRTTVTHAYPIQESVIKNIKEPYLCSMAQEFKSGWAQWNKHWFSHYFLLLW